MLGNGLGAGGFIGLDRVGDLLLRVFVIDDDDGNLALNQFPEVVVVRHRERRPEDERVDPPVQQPTDLLEALLIFGIIWFRKMDSQQGSNFLLFTALTSGARLFLEAFRGDSPLIFGDLRLAQVIAWIVLAGAIISGEMLRKQEKVT